MIHRPPDPAYRPESCTAAGTMEHGMIPRLADLAYPPGILHRHRAMERTS